MTEIAEMFRVTLGGAVTLRTAVQVVNPGTGALSAVDDPGLQLFVRAPDDTETVYAVAPNEIVHDGSTGSGLYHAVFVPDQIGVWTWRWLGDNAAQGASEGQFEVWSIYVPPADPPDLRDLRVLVPRAQRACEGPYGAPRGKAPLTDDVVYAMVADACGEIILLSGSVFGHQLNVTERDPIVGYPTQWATDSALNEWEGAIVIAQVALDYWRFLFRDMKTSVTLQNEGTSYAWTISANVIRDYLAQLVTLRDEGLKGLRGHNFIIDRYWSNIRVRDAATVSLLEWWDTNSPGLAGGGMPGGQEAAVIPWTPGWSGPGFTP